MSPADIDASAAVANPAAQPEVRRATSQRSARVFRIVLLALTVLFAVMNLQVMTQEARLTDPALRGDLLVDLGRPDHDWRFRVTSIDPASPLAQAGVKVNDRVAFDRSADRNGLMFTDELIGLTVHAEGQARHVQVRPAPDLRRAPSSRSVRR